MLLGKLDELAARCKVPFPPRRDHSHIWLECIVSELKSDLIVALACRAVSHRIRADLLRDFDLFLRDQWPRYRRAKQILALV